MHPTSSSNEVPRAGKWTMLWRGATKRCARCGGGGLFTRWFAMKEACPRCHLVFEHEEGYWTGAMMVNLGVTEALFLVVFVSGLMLTWPDPSWPVILGAVVVVSAVTPILFYPFSKTLWVAGDLAFRSVDRDPVAAALERRGVAGRDAAAAPEKARKPD
jgi:uncharacterized protein (DUF983 family)